MIHRVTSVMGTIDWILQEIREQRMAFKEANAYVKQCGYITHGLYLVSPERSILLAYRNQSGYNTTQIQENYSNRCKDGFNQLLNVLRMNITTISIMKRMI